MPPSPGIRVTMRSQCLCVLTVSGSARVSVQIAFDGNVRVHECDIHRVYVYALNAAEAVVHIRQSARTLRLQAVLYFLPEIGLLHARSGLRAWANVSVENSQAPKQPDATAEGRC